MFPERCRPVCCVFVLFTLGVDTLRRIWAQAESHSWKVTLETALYRNDERIFFQEREGIRDFHHQDGRTVRDDRHPVEGRGSAKLLMLFGLTWGGGFHETRPKIC